MKKVKILFILSVLLGGMSFLFVPDVIPDNFSAQQILNLAADSDVIIIFNSGGWGNTPLEKAYDFTPIVKGIQETLNDWGYDSMVVTYNRTKDGFFGKISSSRDYFNSFDFSSDNLAQEVDFLIENLPGKKIILTGLSNGSAFVNKTYEKIPLDVKDSVYAITAGAPFWVKPVKSDNALLIKSKKDTLASGDIKSLLLAFIETPFKWAFSKITGQNLTITQAAHAYGHDYSWSSSEINSQIVSFLSNKFILQN